MGQHEKGLNLRGPTSREGEGRGRKVFPTPSLPLPGAGRGREGEEERGREGFAPPMKNPGYATAN